MKLATLIAAVTLTISPIALAEDDSQAYAGVDEAIIGYGMYEYLVPAVARTYEWDETTSREDIVGYAQCQMNIILKRAGTNHEATDAIVLMSEYTDLNSGFINEMEDRISVLTETDLIDGYYNCLPDVV